MAEPFAGVDLGGTNIKAGIVTADGEVVARHTMPTHVQRGQHAVADRIADCVRRAARAAGMAVQDVAGAGIGSPGTLDLERGVVEFSPNFPDWQQVPLRDMVAGRLGLPCVLDNDANLAALGEQWVGAGRGADAFVLLTLGTGIGGGIVLNGQIWHGANGAAGEVGHMSINPDGPRCGCGGRGCIETYASATAMVRRMREAIEAGTDSMLADDPQKITAAAIHRAAVEGDRAALENLRQTGGYLGVAVSNLMHLLNPAVVAFSGGVTAAGEMLMGPLLAEVDKRTMEACRRNVRVCYAELPEDAGIVGAARCFMLDRPMQ